MFSRLGRWCYRHRWIVVASWVGVLVVFGSILGVVGTETASDPELPDGEEAQIGVDLLEEHFGGAGAGASSPLTFVAEDGYDDPDVREAMEELFAFIESGTEVEAFDEGDIRVTSPYTEDGEQQIATDGPLAEQLAYADVELPPGTSFEDAQELAVEIRDEMPEIEGLEVALGGQMFAEFEEPTAEIIGVAFAIIILIVVFGSVIAMGLPIGTGLAGIGVGSIMAGLLTHVLEVPDFAQMLGVMIGLGVGIDYALFIVTRYRENRHKGQDTEQAIAVAINTAGRAVMFAGITVVISLMGMLIMQLGFITGMATSAATVVLVTMIASLTLLPALIGLVGDRIEVTRWRGLIAAGFVSLALLGMAFEMLPLMAVGLVGALAIVLASFAVRPLRDELPPRKEKPLEESVWFRWSRLIQHHPWPAALVGIAVLVLLAIPVAGLRLGFADEGNAAEGSDARVAYDLVAEGFGPGSNGPLILVAEVPEGTEPSVLLGITETLGVHVPEAGPMTVLGPLPNVEGVDPEDPDALEEALSEATAVQWIVEPPTAPQDEATEDLVHELRDSLLPAATEGTGIDVAVTGSVAGSIDFTDYLGERLPLFLGAVLALSFLLLMVVFRSLLVPLKAVVMNLLGIGAAYGVIVAIFQWGWGGSLIGIDGGPIEPFMPMMLFAIVFGLSMDYEVFLLSRVKEDWDRTGDSHTSVANGLAATARVITAAALIMMVVFGAFGLGDERVLKMAGLGLGFAVFLDATVIRMLLVPATMELLGDKNWWLPGWLDRILPTIDVEGHEEADEDRELETVS